VPEQLDPHSEAAHNRTCQVKREFALTGPAGSFFDTDHDRL
jgi:hypothetical protein